MTCSHKNSFLVKKIQISDPRFAIVLPHFCCFGDGTDVGLSELTYHILRRIIMQPSPLRINTPRYTALWWNKRTWLVWGSVGGLEFKSRPLQPNLMKCCKQFDTASTSAQVTRVSALNHEERSCYRAT